VSDNLPLAVYGVVLIVAMLAWPSGIQGGLRTIGHLLGLPGARRPVTTRASVGPLERAPDAADAAAEPERVRGAHAESTPER
jgi:hypothetical protein